jgi:outer membrane biogenesis lipoprotein LolB
MKALCSGIAAAVLMASGCQAKEPPTQVVYRFDDHRYLELKGWDCEGELWYTDTQRGFILNLSASFTEYLLKICPSLRTLHRYYRLGSRWVSCL